MGSPLGPVLANIFVGYCERKIPADQWPLFYRHFVDDTFSIFSNELDATNFFRLLNEVHPSLTFTMESESGQLPVMDVAIRRTDSTIVRSVHRKPTFTGLYTRLDFFATLNKRSVLSAHWRPGQSKYARRAPYVQEELNSLRRIFEGKGYPRNVIESTISKMVQSTSLETNSKSMEDLVRVDPVVMRLPWIGRHSTQFRHNSVMELYVLYVL